MNIFTSISNKLPECFGRVEKQTTFVSITLFVVGLFFILSIPLLWGYDETAHFARSHQISEGGWTASTDSKGRIGGEMPSNYINLVEKTIEDRRSVEKEAGAVPTRYVSDQSLYTEVAAQKFTQDRKFFGFAGAAAYSPIAYSPPAAGIAFSKVFNLSMRYTILVARFASFFVFALTVISAFFLLRNDSSRFIVIAVSLLPSTVVQSATIGTDSLIIGLALLIFALIKRSASDGFKLSRKLYFLLFIAAVILPLVKINYIFISLLLLLVKPDNLFSRVSKHVLVRKAFTAMVVVLPALLWNLSASSVANNITSKGGVSLAEQMVNVASSPISFASAIFRSLVANDYVYTTGMLGRAGWGGIVFPLSVMVLAALLLCFSVFIASSKVKGGTASNKNFAVMSYTFLASSLFVSLGIFLTLYLTFTPVGSNVVEGVHGRYFIPILPFLLFSMSWLVPVQTIVQNQRKIFVIFMIMLIAMLSYAGIWYRLAVY